MQQKTFLCQEDDVRADHFLTKEYNTSRNQITELIKKGFVSVNENVITKAGFKLFSGDVLHVKIVKEQEDDIQENTEINVDFDVPIVYEDDDILIINKPPHLTVHPAPSVKEATLVDWLKTKNISLSTLSGDERNGIVHRIDKETSGALVIAKNNEAHGFLSRQLEDKSMGRYYLAVVDYPLKNSVIVEKPISRHSKNRLRMAVNEDGKEAKSAFCSLVRNEKIELLAAKLFTGRTHQIRVHLNSIGRHILGDDLYGFKSQKDTIKRVMLHAYCLYLTHPRSHEKMLFLAPLYDDFEELVYKNFDKETVDEAIKIDNIINNFSTFC
ncbi:MAG: RluA family pseudouridine synthase [Campylobacteraceae bacterium]